MPSLIYVEACVKVARFLQTIYSNGGWSDRVLSLIIQGKIMPDNKLNDARGFISIETLNERKASGIARSDISDWVTRIWNVPLDDLSLLDQVCPIYWDTTEYLNMFLNPFYIRLI